MKLDYLEEKKELVSVVLLCATAFFAVLILFKVAGFFIASANAEKIVTEAIAQSKTDEKDTEKYFAKYQKITDELKRNNLFAPPPTKQHPVKEVWGIFGNEVLIKDKWYKVGDMVGDAKIVSIGPTSAKFEWDGREKTFTPIDANGPLPPDNTKQAKTKVGGEPDKRGDQVVADGAEGRRDMEGFRGMRERFQNRYEAELQARRDRQDREILRNIQEKWSTLSEGERKRLEDLKERWPTLPEKERDRIRAGLRERFGG